MDRTELLKKLAKDDVFRVELKNVPLSKCIVRVVKSKSKLPSPAEEAGGAELLADDVLLGDASGLPKDTKLFIRVHLPGAAVGKGSSSRAGTPSWFRDLGDNIDITDPTVVRRKEKCAFIFTSLDEQPVRLLRAPPGSGKTSLGELLIAAAPPGRKVVEVNVADLSNSGLALADFWADQTGEEMAEALNPLKGEFRTYIVDEVQMLCNLGPDAPFWRAVKKIVSTAPRKCRVQMLLMGAYGLQGSKLVGTPIEFRSPWSLELLLLDDAEISEFFGAYNSTCRAHRYPPVPELLQRTMQRVCGRHVGLLREALRLFTLRFKYSADVTSAQQAEFASSELICMGRGGGLRALPLLKAVSKSDKAVLVKVALAGPSGLRIEGSEVLTLPQRLLAAGVLDIESASTGAVSVLRFSSPAMRAHALFNFGVRTELGLSPTQLTDAAAFVRAVVKRMRASELAGSLSKTSAGSKGTANAEKTSLLERQYQMSFYSAAVAQLPAGVFMSPDFGLVDAAGLKPPRRGYIDFFINGKYRIGIELTRDGKQLTEHSARFDGIYAALNLETWVIVDFRKTEPQARDIKDGTVFVVLSADFHTATIVQKGRKNEIVTLLA